MWGGFQYKMYVLAHFHIDVYPTWEREVRQSLYHLCAGIHDVDHSLVDPHLELFSRVLVHECRAVDRVLFNLRGQRHRTNHLCVVAECRVHDLLDARIKDLVLVGANTNTKFIVFA